MKTAVAKEQLRQLRSQKEQMENSIADLTARISVCSAQIAALEPLAVEEETES